MEQRDLPDYGAAWIINESRHDCHCRTFSLPQAASGVRTFAKALQTAVNIRPMDLRDCSRRLRACNETRHAHELTYS